jgi:intein/homing endonuclease
MDKTALFSADSEHGPPAIPLFHAGTDAYFEKTAGQLLPEVSRYIEALRPAQDACYVLVNAMGAGEYYGSNANADHFPEAGLIHAPDDWAHNPHLDKPRSKDWPYGYPTFYYAHPFCFPAGTQVVDGDRVRRPIEEIREGDLVATGEGPRRVTHVMRRPYQGRGVSLRICGEYERLVGTEDHPVLVYRRGQIHCRCGYSRLSESQAHSANCREFRAPIGEPDWAPLSSVLAGDYLAIVRPEHGAEAVDPHFAELVGWVAAEGHLGARGTIQFTFSAANAADIASVRSCLEANGVCVTETPRPQDGLHMLTACSSALHARLSDYVRGVKSEKSLLSTVLRWDAPSLLRMLGAYVDGDGHVPSSGKNKGQLRVRSSSPQMLRMLSDVIRSLGISATVQWDCAPGPMRFPTNGKEYQANGSGVVSVAASWAHLLLARLPTRKSFSFKTRRTERQRQLGQYFLVPVTKRDDVELDEYVFNLEVEDVHHYFAGEVLVHNCHHRNKDATKAFGEVELAAWNDGMKRVELVTRVDKEKCERFGGVSVWDKLRAGHYIDVSMGCFTAGQLVTMSDGTRKPIEDVRVGDRVLTHKGRARRVTETHRRFYKGPLYEIRAEAHETIRCTAQHPFLTVTASEAKSRPSSSARKWREGPLDPTWVHASCLEGRYLLEPVLEETLTPEYADRAFCRLLGYYLAEGHLLRNKQKELVGLELSTHVSDAVHAEIVELCAEFGTRNAPVTTPRGTSPLSRSIVIFDRRLAELCAEHAGSHARKKRLSADVMRWHPDVQRELLGAFANGDGTGGASFLRLSTASTDLAWQLMALLPRLGIAASVQNLEHKAGSGFNAYNTYEWVIHIGKQWAQGLADVCAKVVPSEVRLAKQNRKLRDGYLLTPIREYSKRYAEVEVFNLEVEEDESYLVAGLAVHNCRVPYDTCSACLDWKKYRAAQATFDPKKHAHPGIAVLEWHKKEPIRGVAVTTRNYCEHMLRERNQIRPDGRKVFVYNDYPKFFDISFVFVGADKTAKVMLKIASAPAGFWDVGASFAHAERHFAEGEKTASAPSKTAKIKSGEIVKQVVPAPSAPAAARVLSKNDRDLPRDVLDSLGKFPLEASLSTSGALGIVLRPREFQRIVLVNLGHERLANTYDAMGICFPESVDSCPMGLGASHLSSVIARLLLPFFQGRSALGPAAERRIVLSVSVPGESRKHASLRSPLLHKIGSAYGTYRGKLLDLAAHAQDLLGSPEWAPGEELRKVASSRPEDVFTPLTVAYLEQAFLGEGASRPSVG